nr:GxxExxY protein [uncultured Desulfuromusa sp.]
MGSAYAVGNTLVYGFLEKVYENALAHELVKVGLDVSRQQPIRVYYDGVAVGDYFADLVVEDQIIIELKVVKNIDSIHLVQCLNYLKATEKKLGLLINFGQKRVEVKRVVNNF